MKSGDDTSKASARNRSVVVGGGKTKQIESAVYSSHSSYRHSYDQTSESAHVLNETAKRYNSRSREGGYIQISNQGSSA